MPLFFIKKKYFEKIVNGEKKAELRVGKNWEKLARRMQESKIDPIAIFRSGRQKVVREIYRIEIFPSIKRALASGRWKLLGLSAKTYPEAIECIRRLYPKGMWGPAVLFWLRIPKDKDSK